MKATFLTLLVGLVSVGDNNAYSQQKIQASAIKRTIVAVFAHPDDEIAVSPLLAKYAAEGENVYLVIATDGQNGVTPHAKIPAGDSLKRVRKDELVCAAHQLQIHTPVMLQFVDGALSSMQNFELLHKQLDSIFSLLKPDVVLCWGPDGGYGHPDHRAVSNVVTEIYQEGKNEWPKRLFYSAFPTEAMKNLPPLKTFVGKWLSTAFHTTGEKFLSYRIPCGEKDMATARNSYACHKSQFQPDAMDEIFMIIQNAGNAIYLREPFTRSNQVKKHDLFK